MKPIEMFGVAEKTFHKLQFQPYNTESISLQIYHQMIHFDIFRMVSLFFVIQMSLMVVAVCNL